MPDIRRIDIDVHEERTRIRGVLDGYDLGTFFVYPEFLKAVKDTYNMTGHYLVAETKDKGVTGVASFFERKSPLGRKSLVSIPGGFWAEDGESENCLVERVRRIVSERNLRGPFFRDLYRPLSSLPVEQSAFRAMKPLNGDEKDLLSTFSKNIKRDFKSATKFGLSLEESDDVALFYSIWAHNMRDLGTPPMPIAYFHNLKKYFGEMVKIFLVKKDGAAIGGVFIIFNRNYAIDICLSSLRSHFKFFPNIFLYHEMLRWACAQGIKTFDLGRSQPGSSNEEFKLRFRSELQPLYCFPHAPAGESRKMLNKVMVGMWKHLPLKLSDGLGPHIRRYIPFA